MKIKKDLKRFFNGIALEEKDILLQAAGVSPHKPKTHSRAKLAVAALSVVALVLAAALLIGNMASSAPKNISPDNPSVLNSSLSQDNVLVNSTVTEENEELNINLPIVSCGRYSSHTSSGNVCDGVRPGEVSVETMSGTQKQMDELQDDVLYAVCFETDFYESTKYKEEINRINEEAQEKIDALEDKAVAYLEEHEKEKYECVVEAYKKSNTKDSFRTYAYSYITSKLYYAGLWPDWLKAIGSEMTRAYNWCDGKKSELYRTTKKTTTESMYNYLESLNIKIYEKIVHLCEFTEEGEIKSFYDVEVYRVAFLTKEQIKALKGGDDYGIIVIIAFDEIAKPDNEPVYLNRGHLGINS